MKKTSLVNQLLAAPPAPPAYEPLRNLRKDTIARLLGVTPSYFYTILSGSKVPSQQLHNKIMELVKQVQAETDKKSNHYDESALMEIVAGNVAGEGLTNA